MPIAEEKALEILAELIKKPESKAEDIPRIWGDLIAVYNQHFAPPVEEPKKKRRRKRTVTNPNLGWPAGVSRAEYKAWKTEQEAAGRSENLNPQEYKRLRDAGAVTITPVAAKPVRASAGKAVSANGKGRKAAR
ncbi:MAG: hypothetical protein VKQ33_08265 [Candidatus Sericytochromatia bacterium]|nr:hypothetical protein [Candidatus Sericytochromatia bacterium]